METARAVGMGIPVNPDAGKGEKRAFDPRFGTGAFQGIRSGGSRPSRVRSPSRMVMGWGGQPGM